MRLVSSLAAATLLAAYAVPAAGAPATLKEGTAIHLATAADLSSRTAQVGDRVDLTVAAPVVVDGVTVIPQGARAVGEVSRAKGNGRLGKSGKLSIRVDYVGAETQPIPVRGQRAKEGKSGTLGVVGAAVVFLPLGVLIKGKDARIAAGTPVDVYVAQDVTVETAVQTAGSDARAGAFDAQAAQTQVVQQPIAAPPPDEPPR